jgi:two-component system chemotaxis response regulator CheB
MKPIRVLVVDDSSFNRKVISEILHRSRLVEVVGKAFDGEDAIRKIIKYQPDALTLDLEMPNMDGFAVLRWIMANNPLPVIVVSARESDRSVFKALDLGAVDFVVKPTRMASPQLVSIEKELLTKILAIRTLQLDRIRQRLNDEAPTPPKSLPKGTGKRRAEIVALVSSTGGPPALQRILMGLSPKILSPVLICQHMPAVFTRLFAERLSGLTGRVVKEAEDGEVVLPGHTYIAPGGRQLRIRRLGGDLALEVFEKLPEDRFAPSGNYLLQSLAEACGGNCLAAVLTGMGDDGKDGAVALHAAGGLVLAESEESAVIFGMPKEVIKAGATDYISNIAGITDLINRYAIVQDASLHSP